jgi:glycolate oxidase iron-sulfur subunit
VALLIGCVADRLRPSINRAAVEVLHRNGIEVVETPDIGCCGALALHSGRESDARELARHNVRAFAAAGVDRFVTTAAGCGAMVRDYGRLLADDAELHDTARSMSAQACDVNELLVETGFEPPVSRPLETQRVAYHDACHLLHASGIADAPRFVLSSAIGCVPDDLGENALCCGSAGSYNLDHRAMGLELGRRKAKLAREAGAQVISVANIGCILQLERAVALGDLDVRVAHPIELLAEAYAATKE